MTFRLLDKSCKVLKGALVGHAEITGDGSLDGQAFYCDEASREMLHQLAVRNRLQKKDTATDYAVWEVAVGENHEWVQAGPGDVILFNDCSYPGEPMVLHAYAVDLFVMIDKG